MYVKLLSVASLIIFVDGATSAQDVHDYYRDKTITIIAGSGAGGTTDISARVIAEHLGEHIPGSPTVIVQNRPGGGSVTMTNYLYRSAPRDGTVLGYSLPGIVTAQLLEPDRVRYDSREISWIGSAMTYTGVVSVISSAPATTIAQARETELFIGTTGRGSPAHQFPAMAAALLDLRLEMITGYTSSNEVVLAMERGEVHGQSSSLQYWAISRSDWLEQGRMIPLLYVGPHDPLAARGVPYLSELVQTQREKALVDFIEIGSRMGWPLFAPPGTPPARVETLRRAFSDLLQDERFATRFESSVKATLNPSNGAELDSLVERALATPEAIVSETEQILGLGN
ncbi:MAG: Bug family tripartite tricarboxylate transporter substrate binding protein [Candidatus Rariloculaceae bacterium]